MLTSIAIALSLQATTPTVTTEQDHRETLAMLGITTLRPYADGMVPTAPNAANTDETKAWIWGDVPSLLKFADGTEIKSAKDWQRRRGELLEIFDREVYGRTPKRLPKVSWKLVEEKQEKVGEYEVLRKTLRGVVDNRSYPSINVEIPLTLVTPASAIGKVPVILEFGFGMRPGGAAGPNRQNQAPAWTQQILKRGWGYAVVVPNAYQADSGAGLRSGIIGLVNKGKLRSPDDWGALKAWAWGASRALDYLQSDKNVDGKKVAIEGLSRYGKATLVTMVYEPRFAAAFVGSSGAGGVKLWRRDYGERETNLASSGEYHWMTPNFIKYAGPLTPKDLPVDQHQFLALCAPRPVFVGTGSPNVEGHWVDSRGMFLSTVFASPAWELLGSSGLPTSVMPKEDNGLTDSILAFRQHSGGHTNGPNWESFLDWFGRVTNSASPSRQN